MPLGKPAARRKAPDLDNDSPAVRHEQPRILLIDVDEAAAALLREDGYNACVGTFSRPYRVPRSDELTPVIPSPKLPGFAEQEIIVVDLALPEPADEPPREKLTTPGKKDWWVSCSTGVVDPRPRVMGWVRDDADRILAHGGVFVVFSDMRNEEEVVIGHCNLYGDPVKDDTLSADNWGFLRVLDPSQLHIRWDRGYEITVRGEANPLCQLLQQHARRATFSCALRPTAERVWMTLAQNKYGNPVALARVVDNGDAKPLGWVFIFPQLEDKPGFLRALIREILPDLCPHLFPDVEGARWVERPEYELPRILELKAELEQVRLEAEKAAQQLEQAMAEERAQDGYLHDLLRGTGGVLVSAVKRTLEELGFRCVVDMDEELKSTGDAGPKREDLQIRDESPLVLVEIKGIKALPRQREALQIWGYLAPRMTDLGRVDIRGVSIVNHQRHVPALQRNNDAVFDDDVLTNAVTNDIGLLTTWDLYRLARSYRKNCWSPDQVKHLFYREKGRIGPLPSHYRYVGQIEHFWPEPSTVTVNVEEGELCVGDRIAFELPVEFEEQTIQSLHADKRPATRVTAGGQAGIKTHLTKEQARKGTRVYRIVEPVLEVNGG